MPNPIFNALHSGGQQPNMMQQFQSFMQQMRGQDPKCAFESACVQRPGIPGPAQSGPADGPADAGSL